MELHFSKSVCQCLRKVTCQTVSQEQTQELRLPDAMPDIGRVLGSWGQIVIRSKEWRGNGMNVTGGVMAWILYAPEDGSAPQILDCWIPIQMKWDFPQTQRDGTMCILPSLKGVDARTVSARKLMVRAVVSILGEALEPMEADLYEAPQVPEDISLLKRTYPMVLPLEAGEKSLQMEEQLIFPSSMPPMERILHYGMTPMVAEQKVLLLHDSFSDVVQSFLALGLKNLEAMDLRYFDGSLERYIRENQPDLVIVMINAGEISGKINRDSHRDLFDFR
jgi:hypothetical protein